MRYWPLSVLVTSPLLPEAYAHEVHQFNHRLPSQGAYLACVDVARHTVPVEAPNLVVIETIGGQGRRMFTSYPTADEWLRLERTTMMENDDGFMFMLMEAVH
jgi:hypothetical protein